MAGFDRATALRGGAAGRYRAELDPQWSIAGKLNGGYLLSLCGRAAVAELNGGDEAGAPDAEPRPSRTRSRPARTTSRRPRPARSTST